MNVDFSCIENFKTLMRKAMSYASCSHDYVFDPKVDNTVAMAYLNIAVSKFAAAESLYYSRFDDLQRDEAEDIFRHFDTYTREFLTNIRTDHSHQWTDIEYQGLKDVFDNSAFGK